MSEAKQRAKRVEIMKSFSEYTEAPDDIEMLVESFRRTASTAVVYTYMRQQTAKIKQEPDVSKKIDLLANLINASAAASFAFTQFPSNRKK
jgi:hypothetical protein